MRIPYFIAQKIRKGKNEDKKVSNPIIRIALFSIVLAMIINIITISVVTGFQNKVRDKVIGFGSHAIITKAGDQSAFESSPILIDTLLKKTISNIESVFHIQKFAYKPALLQSAIDTIFYSVNNKDTFDVQQQILGVVMKGIGKDYNWDFFSHNLLLGKLPDVDSDTSLQQLLVSKTISQTLNLKLGDTISTYFIKSIPVKEKYIISGIFQTGLEELDKEIVFTDIRNVQEISDWGIKAKIRIADTINRNNQFVIYADVSGGNGNYRYDWGEGYETFKGFHYCDVKDTIIRLIASDFWMFIDDEKETTVPDTAYLKITVKGNKNLPCEPLFAEGNHFKKNYLNSSGTKFSVDIKGGKQLIFEYLDGKGSFENYIGGWEILVNSWEKLDLINQDIKKAIIYTSNSFEEVRVTSIKEEHEEIFLWLDFLDLNVIIILSLMLIVGVINMISGLLVLIITKTSFIGTLKALGTNNWSIRQVFLFLIGRIVIKGMLIGNLVGIILCLVQQTFGVIPLNTEVYYLSTVPIEINIIQLTLLNVFTFLICMIIMILPSYAITRISPVKAIKFD